MIVVFGTFQGTNNEMVKVKTLCNTLAKRGNMFSETFVTRMFSSFDIRQALSPVSVFDV